MWKRLYEPEMILTPKHARVFREAVSYLSDQIGWGDSPNLWDDDGSVFDRLTQGQKQAVLLEIARALLDDRFDAPSVTAVRAAAVDEVYRTLDGLITSDIETGGGQELRQMVLDAMDETNYWENFNNSLPADEEPVERLSPDCPDLHEWSLLVESLRTSVLDDRDFEMDRQFGDTDPHRTAAAKQLMGIAPDYFTDVPEDPTPARLEEIRRDLYALVRTDV